MIELDPYFDCDGHLLLDALALAAAFTAPFQLDEIRAFEEKKTGLRPHQGAAIALVRDLCGATVNYSGTSVRFSPGPLRSGDFVAEVEGAGPISSVLQAALLPAVLAPGPVTLAITGGTDVLYRPNIAYVEKVLLPYYRMFASVSLKIEKRGTFPRGNGKVIVHIDNQKSPPLPDLQLAEAFERIHLQVIGSAAESEEILEKLQEKLDRPVELERLLPDLNVFSLCLWAEAKSGGNWPVVVGAWRVGDASVKPKFGTKLAVDFLEKLAAPLFDPRVELLTCLAGAPVAETATKDSNELAATKYLVRTLGRTTPLSAT